MTLRRSLLLAVLLQALASGGAIAAASVTLTNNDNGLRRATSTNHAGAYAFPDLPPGKYRVVASLAGFVLLDGASNDTVAFVQAFAGGAILTMLATTMMPEAFENGGTRVGIATTLGFAVAYSIHVYG